MTIHKNILLLKKGERGIVDYPSGCVYCGQPAFWQDGKILVFNPKESKFQNAKKWSRSDVQVKLDKKQTVHLPC